MEYGPYLQDVKRQPSDVRSAANDLVVHFGWGAEKEASRRSVTSREYPDRQRFWSEVSALLCQHRKSLRDAR
jgi:hypothetical protein